jgi:hypothetical protein
VGIISAYHRKKFKGPFRGEIPAANYYNCHFILGNEKTPVGSYVGKSYLDQATSLMFWWTKIVGRERLQTRHTLRSARD